MFDSIPTMDRLYSIVMGILATPPKATPTKKWGLIEGLLTIGFP